MATRYFREQDIDEFRECFFLYARGGHITSLDELTVIMRSLGMSPTVTELKKYFKEKGGKITFADFLEIVHGHTKQENIPQEIVDAFRASDTGKRGVMPAHELRRIMVNWGEKLTSREVDQIFREANISPNGMVRYEDFVRIVCAPVPDYY